MRRIAQPCAAKLDGGSGHKTPTEADLDFAGRMALKGSAYEKASASDQEKYIHGFKNGYEIAFKDASKPAF